MPARSSAPCRRRPAGSPACVITSRSSNCRRPPTWPRSGRQSPKAGGDLVRARRRHGRGPGGRGVLLPAPGVAGRGHPPGRATGNVRIVDFLRGQGRIPARLSSRPSSLRWVERAVRPDDVVLVLGTVRGRGPHRRAKRKVRDRPPWHRYPGCPARAAADPGLPSRARPCPRGIKPPTPPRRARRSTRRPARRRGRPPPSR